MAKIRCCPNCGHSQLQNIGVPGIKQCAQCKALVDTRSRHWFQRLLQELAA